MSVSNKIPQFDIVIVGGGLVGATLALALQKTALNIALLEARSATLFETNDFDVRTVALAESAKRIFTSLNLWPNISAHTTPNGDLRVRGGLRRPPPRRPGKPDLPVVLHLTGWTLRRRRGGPGGCVWRWR